MNEFNFAADTLNAAAPPGERLAYVNPNEEGLLKAVGGSGQESTGGVPSYKKGEVEPPPPRNYGAETRETLQAQIELAPYLYSAEMNQQYGRPAYARGEQDMLWESLLGSQSPRAAQPGMASTGAIPGAPSGEPTMISPQSNQANKYMRVSGGASAFGGGVPYTTAEVVDQLFGGAPPDDGGAAWRAQMAPMLEGAPGAPEGAPGGRGGLLELYEQHIAPSIIRQQRQAAAGEIDMLRELGPQFMEAQRAADPGSEMLRTGLQQRAQAGLDAGQGLTEEELAGITESVRSGQSARGVSFQRSQPGMISETLARLGAGRQAEAQRVQQAQSVLQQTSAVDPFLALTGRSARMPGQVAGQLGTSGFALQAGPQLFNPESQYAGALVGGNQANIMNARMATQANQSAMVGGLLGGLGQLGGGFFTGQGMKKLGGS